MEFTYRRIIGQIDPKKPAQSLRFQLWILKFVGLWAPETENETVKLLYNIWSFFYRGFFLWVYTATQILFFLKVEDLADVAEGFFLLLTQIALLYKVEKFYRNRFRIKKCEKILRSSLFCPKDSDEDEVVKESMHQSLMFALAFFVPAQITISSWAILPFKEEKLRLPIAAWYPFSIENPLVFAAIFFYQIYGIVMSSWFNVSTDTLASAMISHTNSQIQRLGIQLSKIGHDEEVTDGKQLTKNLTNGKEYDVDEEMQKINLEVDKMKKSKSEYYGEVTRCLIFHEHLIDFASEIQDIFRGPIFAQLMASCIIICMTCFLMVQQLNDFGALMSSVIYLATMVTQVLLFCWISNELIYSSNKLPEQAYFSNFQKFDRPSARAISFFMLRTFKEIKMNAGIIFSVTLSLPTFMGILKTSYSYFTLLQTIQDK